jgi:hypothetical protein
MLNFKMESLITNEISSLPFGSGVYIYTSESNKGIWYSSNGVYFEKSDITSGSFGEPVFDNGIWVVSSLGNSTTQGIYYSVDGITWLLSNITDGFFTTPSFNNGVWVIGSSFLSSGIYYSTDGSNWTQSSLVSGNFNTASYYDNKWIIGSKDSNLGLYQSIDGITWTSISGLSSGDYGTPIFANSTWAFPVQSSAGGVVYSSSTLTTFCGSAGLNGQFGDIITNGSIFVICSKSGNGIYYSYDFINWTQTNSINEIFIDCFIKNGVFVAVSPESGILYSKNGIEWFSSNVKEYCYTNPSFIGGISLYNPNKYLFFQNVFIE